MNYPLIIRASHIPYPTDPAPLWVITTDDPLEYQTASEGIGALFPIFMTKEEFCACLYRVKTWKLTGTMNVNYGDTGPGQELYAGTTTIEILFERSFFLSSEPLKEIDLYSPDRRTKLFQSQQQELEFQGTRTVYPPEFAEDQEPQEEPITFKLAATLNSFGQQEIEIFGCGKSLEKENKLAVSVNVALDVSYGNSNIVFFSAVSSSLFANPSAEPSEAQTIAEISVLGPFEEPGSEDLTISLFEFGNEQTPTNNVTFSNLELKPHEWFTYEVNGLGPVYDADTGEFV